MSGSHFPHLTLGPENRIVFKMTSGLVLPKLRPLPANDVGNQAQEGCY